MSQEFQVTPVPRLLNSRSCFEKDQLGSMLGREIWYTEECSNMETCVKRNIVSGVDLNDTESVFVGGGMMSSKERVAARDFLGFVDEVSPAEARKEFCNREIQRLQDQISHYVAQREGVSD